MTEEVRYKSGDFYRICDQTGFKVRASKTRKQWNGYIVRTKSWEPRHPQDLVRGIADYQVVPEARPRPHTYYTKIPIILRASGNGTNYGTPLLQNNGAYIYRSGGLGTDETQPVDPSQYPRSW